MFSHSCILSGTIRSLWPLSSKSISLIKVALNKILRKVWNLPHRSHTSIVHSVAHIPSVSDIVYKRFSTFIANGFVSIYIYLVAKILYNSSLMAYIFTGYNFMYGSHHLKIYNDVDLNISTSIRLIRRVFGTSSPFENLIIYLSCS